MGAWWEQYIGIPFVRRGHAGQGYDCWDLVRRVYADQLGVQLPEYGSTLDGRTRQFAEAHLDAVSHEWVECSEEPMAIALFDVPGGRLHVGIIIGDGLMLHCKAGADTCIEPWRRTMANVIKGFYRPL